MTIEPDDPNDLEAMREVIRDATTHTRSSRPTLIVGLELALAHLDTIPHLEFTKQLHRDAKALRTLLERAKRKSPGGADTILAQAIEAQSQPAEQSPVNKVNDAQTIRNAISTSKAEATLRGAKHISQSEAVRAALRIINGA